MGSRLIPKKPEPVKIVELPKSAGILDDYAVRKNVATKEGTIEHVPTQPNHIVNKKYCDDIAMAYLNQAVKTTSTPYFSKIGIGTNGAPTNLLEVKNGALSILKVGKEGKVNFHMGGEPNDDYMFYMKEDRDSYGLLVLEGQDGGTLRVDTFDGNVNFDNVHEGGTLFIGRDMYGENEFSGVFIGNSNDEKGLFVPALGNEDETVKVLNTDFQVINGDYKSNDGTRGVTGNVAVAKVGGGTRTLIFKNGLYVGYTDS